MLEEVDWLLDEESCSDSEPEKYDVSTVLSEKRVPMVLVEVSHENPFLLPPREVKGEESVCSQLIAARRQSQIAASRAAVFTSNISSKNKNIQQLKSEFQRSSEIIEQTLMRSYDESLRESNQKGHLQLQQLSELIESDADGLVYEISSLQNYLEDVKVDKEVIPSDNLPDDSNVLNESLQIPDDDIQLPTLSTELLSLTEEERLCNESASEYSHYLNIVESLEAKVFSMYAPKVIVPLQLEINSLCSQIRLLEEQLAGVEIKNKPSKQLLLPVMGASLKSSVLL